MFNFFVDELVWAARREREEEARQIRPHTEKRPDAERAMPQQNWGYWVALALRGCTPAHSPR
jgi:hypothetical protein